MGLIMINPSKKKKKIIIIMNVQNLHFSTTGYNLQQKYKTLVLYQFFIYNFYCCF